MYIPAGIYILKIILLALRSNTAPEVEPEVTPEVKKMLKVLIGDMSRKQIQEQLGLKDEKHFREAYQQPAVSQGFVEMTIPDKPNSRLQKYRLTPKGRALLGNL